MAKKKLNGNKAKTEKAKIQDVVVSALGLNFSGLKPAVAESKPIPKEDKPNRVEL